MRNGQARHKITLQGLGARVDDGHGGGSISFTDVISLWASIEPLTGDEILRAGQMDVKMTHRVRHHYYPGVRPSWRVVYGSRVFDIKHVNDPEERHRELELICEELVTW